MDEDPTTGFRDYSCRNFTYDGHAGCDIGLHSFSEQVIGVPVFAAADGVVVYSHDGEPDQSTCLCGTPANALIIDHGGGRYGWYWHFRQGTVAATVGQNVVAGTQLGFAASSGNSAGPHLHFGIALSDGTPIDPFSGTCGPAQSMWATQPAMDLHSYVADFGYMIEPPFNYPGYPFRYPNTGQMGADQFLWFWMQLVNLPPQSTWRQEYLRPDGTLAFDSGNVNFGNNEFARVSNYWFYHYYLWEMRQIMGTWRIRFSVNGAPVITAPVEVRQSADPNFNRAPGPVTLSFDPSSPSADDVLFCRVNGPLALDDPDYDLVRYEYVWKRNGQEIRRHTLAGRADAFPRNSFTPGDTITCEVRPSDGRLIGPLSAASITITGTCLADFNADTVVDFFDYLDFVAAFSISDPTSDFNADTIVDFFDYLDFVSQFAAGC
jgi:hypothetical protein